MPVDIIEIPDPGDASHVVSSGDTALVIDPQRDLDRVETCSTALARRSRITLEYANAEKADLPMTVSARALVPQPQPHGRSLSCAEQRAVGAAARRPGPDAASTSTASCPRCPNSSGAAATVRLGHQGRASPVACERCLAGADRQPTGRRRPRAPARRAAPCPATAQLLRSPARCSAAPTRTSRLRSAR